jgi:hypothetical protein
MSEREVTRDAVYKQELSKLRGLFGGLPENEQRFLEPMMHRAAFIRMELERLEETIYTGGCVDSYQNGENQTGRKASAEIQSYNSLLKNYNTLMNSLASRLPKEEKKSAMAEMMAKYS